jgi:uncharacterized protein YwgA/O-acetyl-ADP-ribose deacetylase (regulator of RNase III)
MSSSTESNVSIRAGDLLASRAQTLVNTVNCVGIMGKGIALAFKRRYPDMYQDYVRRCDRGEVQLGRPYPYQADDHLIVNFPTKKHWRAVSRLEDIVKGLEYLTLHYREWGITSIAVPPLGCGNGQLEWDVVGPTLYRHLSQLDIPVELYAPHDAETLPEQLMLGNLAAPTTNVDRERFVEPEWVAVIAVLDRLERQPHHWPVGRIMFQKLVYFATQAGVPTGMEYEPASFGPYAHGLKRMVAKLQNNGLATERQRGRMLEVRVGKTYPDAVTRFRPTLELWRDAVERTVDLMSRMDTQRAETAASVHYVTASLTKRDGRRPTATQVLEAVEDWKLRRKPPITREQIAEALALLAMRGWISVELDKEFEPLLDELSVA